MALRAALIGCGKIGSDFADDPLIAGIYTHAGAWAACEDVELVAVCDLDADRARRCAARWRVPHHYTDVARMLETIRPDLVSVCTPDATHAEVLSIVLDAPGVRGVLAEKPLAMTVAEGRKLASRAGVLGIVLAINYSRRYAPGHRELARRLRAGLVGEIRQIRGCYTKGTIHNGTHWFDWARMLASEITAVRGFDALREGGVDPTLDARLEFANGAAGTLAALGHRDYSVFEIDILGSHGRLQLVDSGHRYVIHVAGDSPRYSGYCSLLESESGEIDMNDILLHAATDLVESIHQGRAPLCTAPDAIQALQVAEAIRLSASTGNAVKVVGG